MGVGDGIRSWFVLCWSVPLGIDPSDCSCEGEGDMKDELDSRVLELNYRSLRDKV